MALDQTYYSLKNVQLTLDLGSGATPMTVLTELQIPWNLSFSDRTAGGSAVEQKVPDRDSCTLRAVGWNGDSIVSASFLPRARITSATVLSTQDGGTPSFVPDEFFTTFPVAQWMIGNVDTTLGPEPSKWTVEIHTNVL